MNKSKQLNLRLSERDASFIRTAAKLSNQNVSTFVAQKATMAAIEVMLDKLPHLERGVREQIRRMTTPETHDAFASYYREQVEKMSKFIDELNASDRTNVQTSSVSNESPVSPVIEHA